MARESPKDWLHFVLTTSVSKKIFYNNLDNLLKTVPSLFLKTFCHATCLQCFVPLLYNKGAILFRPLGAFNWGRGGRERRFPPKDCVVFCPRHIILNWNYRSLGEDTAEKSCSRDYNVFAPLFVASAPIQNSILIWYRLYASHIHRLCNIWCPDM